MRNLLLLLSGTGVSDTTAPTVVITSSAGDPTATSPIPITVTFSESVTEFVVGDITVAGCTLSNFAGSGAVYTVDATPTALGTLTVDVAAGVCMDAAGNANEAASQFSIVYNTLTVSLSAAIHMDETSDGSGAVTRADATGNGNTFSDINTTPSAAGLLANGCDFERDNTEALDRASTASLLVGDIGFTTVQWVKLETGGITQYLAAKGTSSSAAGFAWRLYVDGANAVTFLVSNGTTITGITSNQALSVGVWALVMAWHDAVNDQIGIQISDNAPKTAAYSGGVVDSAGFAFKLASSQAVLGVAGTTLDGMLDEPLFYKKVLNSLETTALWNGGAGRAYPFF